MSFDFSIRSITFSDGTCVELPAVGVVAIVGPNNAGKTATLKEIGVLIEGGTRSVRPRRVVKSVDYVLDGGIDDISAWLMSNCQPFENLDNGTRTFHRGSRAYRFADYAKTELNKALSHPERGLGDLFGMLSTFLGVADRLSAAAAVEPVNQRSEPAKLPLHELLTREDVESELRQESRRAFGAEFIICRAPERKIHVYWGEEPGRTAEADRVSTTYLEKLRRLPSLDEQGDGIRSFLGTLFHLKLATERVIFLDEPEAFLHPPQAYRLGLLVGQLANDRQVLLSTHSGDFLRGLMDSRTTGTTVIHLRRSKTVNVPRVLRDAEVARLRDDAALRYGNLLDGLFHDTVVICESEIDCRFYHMAAERAWQHEVQARPNPLFVDVGGKTGIPAALSSLTSLGVPVRVVADFDILNSEQPLRRVCEALSMEWDTVRPMWEVVKKGVEKQGSAPPAIEDVRVQLNSILSNGSRRLDEQTSKRLTEAVKYPSPWAQAKRQGKSYLPSGAESQAVEKLLEMLETRGLFVVPVGELECWVRTTGGKSAAWLQEIFFKDEFWRGSILPGVARFRSAFHGDFGRAAAANLGAADC